jgi:D-alanyl-D-alanine carboxypeptidase
MTPSVTASPTTVHRRAVGVSPTTDARLAALLDRIVRSRSIPHVSLMVASDDGERWEGAAGAAGPAGVPLRPDTPFFVASVTKRFIITLVLQAHERSELHLDDPVVAHLPREVVDGLHVLRVSTTHGRSPSGISPATRPDCPTTSTSHGPVPACTRSCLPDTTGPGASTTSCGWSREDHRPRFAPQDLDSAHQKARYSDTGFQLLIRLLETVTGTSYGDLLLERIVEPLGLQHTWLPGRTRPQLSTETSSTIYARTRPLDMPRMVLSSNDLASTTEDLLRFHRALLAGCPSPTPPPWSC